MGPHDFHFGRPAMISRSRPHAISNILLPGGTFMNRWLSTRTAAGVGWFLVGVGLLPFVCLLLWVFTRNSQPVSERILLQRGQFISRYFKPELDGAYQVSLNWLNKFPSRETQVDLDWEIVDSQGLIIDQGTYDSSLDGSNIVKLGEYHPQRGVRQRIIVNVHRDVNGPDGEARLDIGIPEVTLDVVEGAYPLAVGWAAITTIPGVVMLTAIWFWRRYSLRS
jgi:hypothetical protein